MQIKEICLNNFRIYKGENHIDLLPQDNKNIVVISGKNGFGKTTFLMSLVWCLYGKQMEHVDELYKKEIADKGSYGKYIGSTLNSLARIEGKHVFSVSVTFINVKIPEITCNEVKITRTLDTISSTSDRVEVLIDGYPNQLIQDLTTDKQDGAEVFIRDFILPIEVAKFFFFDAEKIVSLAEINSHEQRKMLSKAYTEVLGIKKYEDLKERLENIQDKYRKLSATKKDKAEFNEVEARIKNQQLEIEEDENTIQKLNEEKNEKRSESDEIQAKLIQAGTGITVDEINNLKNEETDLEKKLSSIQNELTSLFALIPFGLAGETLMEVSEQIKKERVYEENKYRQEDIQEKTTKILQEIDDEKKRFEGVVPVSVRDFYETQIKRLIKKHFFADVPDISSSFQVLHDFSSAQANEINTLINNLKFSFKESFGRISDSYSRTRSDIDSLRRKIRNAESDAEDEYISELRKNKDVLDQRISDIEDEIRSLYEKIGEAKLQIKTSRQEQESLRKKLDESRTYTEKDHKTQQLLNSLKVFIREFKDTTKKKLEENILKELTVLMHKRGFIHRVEVSISQAGDDIDIILFNDRNEKIDKSSLSMGERQMYASALLKSLVAESDIEFPVFIDSPMQKFDNDHAENVIKEFYPKVSNQVVIFPLLLKELTEKEYNLLLPNVSRTYIIDNVSPDASHFMEVNPECLIDKYNELYAN